MSGPTVEYLVEIVAYDPALPGTVTLRYSTIGKTTGPAETPANTFYDARLQEPGVIRRAVAEGRELFGAARISVGEIVLQNLDGALDVLATYGFDGRDVTIRSGAPGAAYPGGYTTRYVGTMDDVEVTRNLVRIRLRDNTYGLDTPLQTTTYDGDNVLPDGLEGVAADLKGKPKPLLYGVAKNLPVPVVNTAKLIYQVSDSAVTSIEGVYDRGIALGFSQDLWNGMAGVGAALTELKAMTYGQGELLAVGVSGFMESSTLGGTVTARTSGFGAATIHDMHYSEDEDFFVAVGESGTLTTSPDKATWTNRTSQFASDNILAVCRSEALGLWIAVGVAGKISTSPTGVTWTARTSGIATALRCVAAAPNGRVVAAGVSGAVIYSDDGITWSDAASAFGASEVWGIVHADRLGWIAVGASGKIQQSANGIEWADRVSGTTGTCRSVTYGEGRLLVGAGAEARTSTDGQSWSPAFLSDASPGMTIAQTVVDVTFAAQSFFLCVNDLGIPATGTVYRCAVATAQASSANLLSDANAPEPGNYSYYLAGGLIRLGSPPAGLITVDATQGAAAANRTAGQLFVAVLTKAGYTTGDWSASDITALDSADNSECGLWVDSGISTFEALDAIASSVGAWWGTDKAGVFRVKQWTTPSGTPALAFVDDDFLALERLPSDRPTYRTTLQYARNYVVQGGDVAFGVSDARRAALAKEWREAVNEVASVQTMHLLADATVEPTLFSVEADAVAEATRRQTLRGTKRIRISALVKLNADTEALDLGDVVTVTSTRFGLSAGVDFRITALEPQRATGRLRLSLWGG